MAQRRWPAVSARLWEILEARGHGSRVRFADALDVDSSNVTRWTRPDSGTDFPPEYWDLAEETLEELEPGELRSLAGVSSAFEDRLRHIEERLGRVETHLGIDEPSRAPTRGSHLHSVDLSEGDATPTAAMPRRTEPRRESDRDPSVDEFAVDDPGPDDGA